MPSKEIPVVGQPVAAVPQEDEPTFPRYAGPAFLSYGFRPFFLGAAVFSAASVLAWVTIYAGYGQADFLYPPREWHVHEMLFGYIPALIAGFLLTAMPNWTDRMPLRGVPLLAMFLLWLAGRLLMAIPFTRGPAAAVIDGAFLVFLAAYVWREISAANAWDRTPIGVLVSLYAATNVLFHLSAVQYSPTDLPERLALSIMTMMLTVIGGRLTPTFTIEYLEGRNEAQLPAVSTRFDAVVMLVVLLAVIVWVLQPESNWTGIALIVAGLANLVRLLRWRGWKTWREPLVCILNVGYGWIGLYLIALGAAILGVGFEPANAVHLLTTGAMGAMTLAVMTRASLGHTGRPRHADRLTVAIYLLVNAAALLRIFAPHPETPTALTHAMLEMSALGWSGAYLLFVFHYGPYLVHPSLDE